MRMIQTKLNTPSDSTKGVFEENKSESNSINYKLVNTSSSSKTNNESTMTTKRYSYQGPPTINLSTWSERPKTKVTLKEDTDYKINKKNFNTTIKCDSSKSGIEITHFNGFDVASHECDSNVRIKLNTTEPIMIKDSGNLIKIPDVSSSKKSDDFSTRFINHTTAMGYRKPLSTVNKIDKCIRPRSVALSTYFDISRAPIVRSVEFKKTLSESDPLINTSITQINQNINTSNFSDVYRSSEALNEINTLKPQVKDSTIYLSPNNINTSVTRVNSFVHNRQVPVVMGFKNAELINENTSENSTSWNVFNTYSTLPLKINSESRVKNSAFSPNSNLPFSRHTLRETETNKLPSYCNNNNMFGKAILRNTHTKLNFNKRYSTGSTFGISDKVVLSSSDIGRAPLPPLMPKVTSVTKKVKSFESAMDSRDELLSSIRNFGGIKELKHVKKLNC